MKYSQIANTNVKHSQIPLKIETLVGHKNKGDMNKVVYKKFRNALMKGVEKIKTIYTYFYGNVLNIIFTAAQENETVEVAKKE